MSFLGDSSFAGLGKSRRRERLKMGRFRWIAVTTLVFSLALLGCEKLPEFLRFGRPEEEEAEAPKPPIEAVKGTVLARVGDRVITLEEFNEKFEVLPEEAKDFYLKDPKGKERFLDELINRELLIKEAIDRRLDYDEGILKEVAEFKERRLWEKLIEMEVEKVRVTPAEIENYYKTFKEEFTVPEERRVRTIVLATEEEARAALIELLRGADFVTLARERSIGPNKEEGGDIGFIIKKPPEPYVVPPEKKTMFRKFEEAAFSLDLGGISSLVKGPDGYYIIRVEEIKEARQRTLYDVREDLERGLLILKQNQALMSLVENLKKKTPPEIHRELLEAK